MEFYYLQHYLWLTYYVYIAFSNPFLFYFCPYLNWVFYFVDVLVNIKSWKENFLLMKVRAQDFEKVNLFSFLTSTSLEINFNDYRMYWELALFIHYLNESKYEMVMYDFACIRVRMWAKLGEFVCMRWLHRTELLTFLWTWFW